MCICVCVCLVKKGEELRSTELHGAREAGKKKLRGKSIPLLGLSLPGSCASQQRRAEGFEAIVFTG